MIFCGFFCGSKQDHVLSHAFFQILDNMMFWKISTWVNLIGDEVIDLREKELKYSAQIMNVLGASTTICILSGLLVVSNFCG